MRFSSAALAALLLLLGAGAARAPHLATEAAAAVTDVSNCTRLASHNTDRVAMFGWRRVSYKGRAVTVTLVWGSEPARAAAALLAALLRHVRLYRGVLLSSAAHPHSTAALAANVTYAIDGNYDNLVIGVSTAWEPAPLPEWKPFQGADPGLAGPRLREFGASPVPARRRLFVWLTGPARDNPDCCQYERWSFYANTTLLENCNFKTGNNSAVEVLGVGNCNTILQRLEKRVNASNSTLLPRQVTRLELLRTMTAANHSFLFLDYDMWESASGVRVVEPPPCATDEYDCKQEIDSAIAMRVADVNILQAYAPKLLQFVRNFRPPQESLRYILERQARGQDIEDAACEWALSKYKYHVGTNDRNNYDLHHYVVAIYLCMQDPSNSQLEKIGNLFGQQMFKKTSEIGYEMQLIQFSVNCSDDYHMSNKLNKYTRTIDFYKLVGVVSMTVEGAAAASATAAANRVPLLLADVVPEDGTADAGATWRVAGRPRHIARAIQHFVLQSGWKRVAVLSQPTKLAADYFSALNDETEIIFRQFKIPHHMREQNTQEVLEDLQATNARIVFVNADSRTAATILTAAVGAGMGYADGFVWIVRDWQQDYVLNGTKHFTVSFWIRGVEDISPTNWLTTQLKEQNQLWVPRAVSFADALFSLSMGFENVLKQFPNLRQDLHSAQMIRSLKESLIVTPVMGVSKRLSYKERSIEETFVFVDQYDETFTRLATWRVNATSGAVRGKNESQATYSRPTDLPRDDGSSGCHVRSGDKFDPTCHDIECACALLLLALAPAAVLLARRRFARLQHEQQIQVIARRQHVATVLASYLVKRTALELHEELGAGRFGSVRLAKLREPGRALRYVAAKALRDNAAPSEESEFLREACTIASLTHAHIVRLVGVCIVDGPPLVLMELAFFGDLLGYLRARRHLVEGVGLEAPEASGEAENVSAEALTRLAREAAEALQYLSVRGVVHRDVRAANCLVDVRRSLKLADFGMARDTVAGADGAPEYACRRRGLFPVLWMAPESLAHGVFSAASDVWALGVLVLELVTLGVRPYGTMSPLRVLEYVAAGGSPPLPLDATPQTRGLARLCWARAAERRPSAAEVAAYLSAWPLALHPALLSQRDEPADADSGFGESPSTELLPPDSPLHSFEELDHLAATH